MICFLRLIFINITTPSRQKGEESSRALASTSAKIASFTLFSKTDARLKLRARVPMPHFQFTKPLKLGYQHSTIFALSRPPEQPDILSQRLSAGTTARAHQA